MTGGALFWRTVGQALADGRDVIELDLVADALRMGGPHPVADALRAAAPGMVLEDWVSFLETVNDVGVLYENLRRQHGQAELNRLLGLVAEALARSRRGAAAAKEGASHARADH